MGVLMLVGIAFIFCFAMVGIFRYDKLKSKWSGIMGVGKGYFIATGLVAAVGLIIAIVMAIKSRSGSAEITSDELLAGIIVCLIFVILGVFLFLGCAKRCETKAQVIMLPFVALLMSFGFSLRLMGALFTLISPGGSEASGEASEENDVPAGNAIFWDVIKDEYGNEYKLQSTHMDAAYYISPDGELVTVRRSELSNDGRFVRFK